MQKYSFSLYLLILAVFLNSELSAQQNDKSEKEKNRLWGVEFGVDGFFATVPDYDFIRGDILPYYYSNVSEAIKGTAYRWFAGVKTELKNKHDVWGYSIGLRYSRLISSLGKESYFSSPSEFFYFLDNQDGLSTNYLRVKEINRNLDYIGVPIEIRRIRPYPETAKLYLKLGVDFQFLINQNKEVLFYNNSLKNSNDLVLSKFDNPAKFFSTIYLAFGVNFDIVPNLDFELILPHAVLTPDNTNLISIHSGIGAKLGISLPY